ncbi:MAG: acetate--CoA ligase [Thiobacillus sp.]|nr:acetate--CoA ligase [Thiobacillus sp.]
MAAIESILTETRVFPPADDFVRQANISGMAAYRALSQKAEADYAGFWAGLARQHIDWHTPFTRSLDESQAPFYKWFEDGELNVSYNCLDRHLATRGDQTALIFEADDGGVTQLSYKELHARVCQLANGLQSLGVEKGDRVIVYMPMSIEAVVAMQACARIGAIHSVVFGGFSAKSLFERIEDARAKVVITADEGMRGGKAVALKRAVDEALAMGDTTCIERVIVYRRTGGAVNWSHRDLWWHELTHTQAATSEPVWVSAEHPLFILYTSGSTGKPKGVQHSTGGYLLGAILSMQWVFDAKPDTDVYWCTADVGWITGHSYIVYGPLANGATQVMYEGVPNYPANDRFWAIIEKYRVSKFYTAPTAIRTFMKWGAEEPAKHDLSSLKLLGSVGEPINPEAWMWYQANIGGGTCPIVDTWWQTETGGIMISPLPGCTTTKPGSATFPLPGVAAEVVDDDAQLVTHGGGYLTLTQPWPGMLRGIWGDPERYHDTYWSRFEGRYFAGDGCKLDDGGYLWLLGRVDDVMNVSGHRISTAEVESALVSHPSVAEAAVVGANDNTTGQAIIAYVTLRGGLEVPSDELRSHVAHEIGAIAKPKAIFFTPDLPKTRSGKIMRRLLRDVAEGRNLGDTTTLADASVVNELQRRAAEAPAED